MANAKVRLRFLAMERSLRAQGCRLPLWVIPYDDDLFDLPPGAAWWDLREVSSWLGSQGARPVTRKYQCAVAANYQFVDADVCFLKNPEKTLEPHAGFVTSCGHWHNPSDTVTDESRAILSARTTTWQKSVFNSGQFACDQALFDVEGLKSAATRPDFAGTCIHQKFHEQPGLNLLVCASGVAVTNLTLPPHSMESSWAGDYSGGPETYWRDEARRPYLIHWAGTDMGVRRPINEIFLSYLTAEERVAWDEQVRRASSARRAEARSIRAFARRCKRVLRDW